MKPVLNRWQSTRYPVAVAWVVMLIVYGSLFPFTWDFATPQDFIFSGDIELADVLENVALFFPLGLLLAFGASRAPRHAVTRFVVWLVLALLLAAGLQWLQKFLPRTPALSDVAFNLLGHLLGWGVGAVLARLARRLVLQQPGLRQGQTMALVLLACWWMAELFPLLPAPSPAQWLSNLLGLWQQPWWDMRRMVGHIGMTVMGLTALAVWMRSIQQSRHVHRWALAAAALVLLGKFVGWGQRPAGAVVLGIAAGTALWWWLDRMGQAARSRPAAHQQSPVLVSELGVAVVAVATYALQGLWPFQWPGPVAPMQWLPFASSLSSSIEAVMTNVAFECLCFGTLILGAVRCGLSRPVAVVGVAGLSFAVEWGQRWQPTRTAEITSVVLALGMGWLVLALQAPVATKSMPGGLKAQA